MAKKRPNVIPIIEDARHPQKYRMLVPMVDVVFADVAQPDQVRSAAGRLGPRGMQTGRVLSTPPLPACLPLPCPAKLSAPSCCCLILSRLSRLLPPLPPCRRVSWALTPSTS